MKIDDVPPRHACDCHVHVVGPKRVFPLTAGRSYTPPDAPVDALRSMLGGTGMERVVIVQPSIYGSDNRCALNALAALGSQARMVAAGDAATMSGSEIDAWHALGVRGLRVNLDSGGTDIDIARTLLTDMAIRCARNGWHVQLFMRPALLGPLLPILNGLPVPVVFDHFAMLEPSAGMGADERMLLGLIETGRTWVKLSGWYRVAADPLDSRLASLARRLATAAPERLVWGSDWPHTPAHTRSPVSGETETPYRPIDTISLVGHLRNWIADPILVRRILVDNPATLYDFPTRAPDALSVPM